MRTEMAEIRLPFTRHDRDRHGNERWYYVSHGKPKVRLNPKGVDIGSPEFFERYRCAHEGSLLTRPQRSKPEYMEGTLAYLIDQYLKSPEFNQLRDSSQNQRRPILLKLAAEHGHRSSKLTTKAVRAGLQARKATPAAANNRLKAISAMYNWALKAELAEVNPTVGVKKLPEGPGFKTWPRTEIERYRNYWPLGSRQRLALELLYGTAQRRSDVAFMGPQHIDEGTIRVVQQKTDRKLVLPIDPVLAEALNATKPASTFSFLGFKNGNSFGTAFRKWCIEAGVAEYRAHGLRKARATHLAEAGRTIHQIASVTGHKSLSEVQRYTEAADQKRLATEAIGEQSVPLSIPLPESGTLGDKNQY